MLALEQLLRSQHLSSPAHASAPIPTAHTSHTQHSLMNGHSQGTQRADSMPTLAANQRIGERSSVVSPGSASVAHIHTNGHLPSGKLDDELQRAFSRSERLCAELRERCQQIERMQNNITQLDETLPAGKILLPDVRASHFTCCYCRLTGVLSCRLMMRQRTCIAYANRHER